MVTLPTASLRRVTAAVRRRYLFAAVAVILITAVAAVVFSFAEPSVDTARLFYSADDSSVVNSTDVDLKGIDSKEVNSDNSVIAAPPLDSEEIIITSERFDDNEVHINSASIPYPAPSSMENFSGDQVKWDSHDIQLELPNNPESNESTSIGEGPRELPLQSEKPVRLTETDRQLIDAKKEINNAPVILDDSDLYAPLFQNVSVFKRSYELMESILKVYIYKDGQRPIFHTPILKGIYASEGWFLKLMEANKKFVVKNPKSAHLFYLPYSARQLQYTLYKPDSHNLRPLAIFLKDYVDLLSEKYPFWNRTRGADHFLVACHDWVCS